MAIVQSKSDHLLEYISDLDARMKTIADQTSRIEMDIQELRAQQARLDADYDRISALRDDLETLMRLQQ